MYPQTVSAHVVVAIEAIVRLSVTALSTGLVFKRFSQPRAEVVFASRLCISPVDGRPSLQCRLGNDRDDVLVPRPDGKLTIALERFDDIEPTAPTPTSPHEWRPRS